MDTFYLIFAGALVFFMQFGFAMLCAGSIREKNVKNVLLWNLLDSAGGAVGFWSLGYAFAYGGASGRASCLVPVRPIAVSAACRTWADTLSFLPRRRP